MVNRMLFDVADIQLFPAIASIDFRPWAMDNKSPKQDLYLDVQLFLHRALPDFCKVLQWLSDHLPFIEIPCFRRNVINFLLRNGGGFPSWCVS